MVTSDEPETNFQQIQGITYYGIQALPDHAPTGNCQLVVEKAKCVDMYVPLRCLGNINSILFACFSNTQTKILSYKLIFSIDVIKNLNKPINSIQSQYYFGFE